MKFILVFMFFVFANCLAPPTVHATIKSSFSNSSTIVVKKLNPKQRLLFKASKNSLISSRNKEWIYSLLLMFVGLLILGIPSFLPESTPTSITMKALMWVAALVVAVLGFFTFLVGLLKLMEYLRIKRENQ